jgi:nitric oxide reductase NorE protein
MNDILEEKSGWGALDELPGNPIMWVLIISELLVFGALFIGFSINHLLEPETFIQSQNLLSRMIGGMNTLVLLTSGYFAALALRSIKQGEPKRTGRLFIIGAMVLGLVFCGLKIWEYADKAAQGISIETNDFFTLFYLMTGFHFLHVIFGLILLAISLPKFNKETLETVCSFWHMVDMIWVLLYPLVYLVR